MENRTAKQALSVYALIPIGILISGAGILAYQGYFWLSQGYWRPLKAYHVFDRILPTALLQWHHNCNWAVVRQALTFTFNLPLALFLIGAGLLMLILLPGVCTFYHSPAANESEHWRR
jgi:hypothetical protein